MTISICFCVVESRWMNIHVEHFVLLIASLVAIVLWFDIVFSLERLTVYVINTTLPSLFLYIYTKETKNNVLNATN